MLEKSVFYGSWEGLSSWLPFAIIFSNGVNVVGKGFFCSLGITICCALALAHSWNCWDCGREGLFCVDRVYWWRYRVLWTCVENSTFKQLCTVDCGLALLIYNSKRVTGEISLDQESCMWVWIKRKLHFFFFFSTCSEMILVPKTKSCLTHLHVI